jgi:hypothetical protein
MVAHGEGGLRRSSGGGGHQNGYHGVQRWSLTSQQEVGSSDLAQHGDGWQARVSVEFYRIEDHPGDYL